MRIIKDSIGESRVGKDWLLMNVKVIMSHQIDDLF